MCGSVLDLCRSTAASGRGFTLDPQQLQTAMSLYTSDVCALVMVEETGPVTSSREGEWCPVLYNTALSVYCVQYSIC